MPRSMRSMRSLSSLALFLAASSATLVAQGTTSSALTGVVRDPSGKPMAGVLVRVSSSAMIGGERTTRTSENGSYRVPMLPPGLYKISVETPNFPGLSGLEILELGNTSIVNWKFQPAATATVEVVSNSVGAASGEAVGVSTSLTSEVLANVPTGRDLTQVAALTPGVNATDTTSGAAVRAWGGDIYGNSYTIDGLNVGDAKSGEKWVYANPDWFSQVQVSGLGASAEFGGFSGAVINGVSQGAVKVAVRPEAWHIGPPGTGLAARLAKAAYLGSNYEYSFETELGPIFVVSPDLGNVLDVGADVGLRLADHGVSVVQVS